jgi:hypothetical protein
MDTMTRRCFAARMSMILALGGIGLTVSGCGPSTIIAFVNIVNGAILSILPYVENVAIADAIKENIASLDNLINEWVSGPISIAIVDTIRALINNLDLIPLSSKVTTFISLALNALVAILSISNAPVIQANVIDVKPLKHPKPAKILDTQQKFVNEWDNEVDKSSLPYTVKINV